MPLRKIGAFSEFIAIDQDSIAIVPEYLSDEEKSCQRNIEMKDHYQDLKVIFIKTK